MKRLITDLILNIQMQISLLLGNLYLTDLVKRNVKFDVKVYCKRLVH